KGCSCWCSCLPSGPRVLHLQADHNEVAVQFMCQAVGPAQCWVPGSSAAAERESALPRRAALFCRFSRPRLPSRVLVPTCDASHKVTLCSLWMVWCGPVLYSQRLSNRYAIVEGT